ncbi:hypothetical protein H4Q32_024515 [Labeo rohita]|uniref:Uncharacterized protein n=1 Tax=Labeo rohita TaxID=84645 RepID=A0ABQ8KZB2_LABRO|nr:hypothetical protein H4Q32_024515 [Labeo rohita]
MALSQSGMNKNQKRQQLEDEMEKIKAQCDRSELSVEELKKKRWLMAELEIIRLSQEKMFPDELASLKRGESIKRSSHIYGLCTILEDVLRVGEQLSRASIPEESKHPVILAKFSHIADILLPHIHQEVGHSAANCTRNIRLLR